MNRIYVFFLFLLTVHNLIGQDGDTLTADLKTEVNNLLRAYNSGDSVALDAYVRTSHHPKVLEQVPVSHLVNRMASLYHQYGPVEPMRIENVSPTSTMIWTRGKSSKAWLGLLLMHTEKAPHKVTTIGIDRGQIPPEPYKIPRSSSVRDFKTTLRNHVKEVDNTKLFSGSVQVSLQGKNLISEISGLADRTKRVRNDKHSLFLIASTSKMITAACILQLQERGLVLTTDPISKFIPDYPRHIGEKVTVHHLLTHTAGIELDELEEFKSATAKAQSIKELVDWQIKCIPKIPELVNFTLPDQFNYSNEGYALLARIIEAASGVEYWEYVAKNIFERAGMTDSYPSHRAPRSIVKGYTNRSPDNGAYLMARQFERTLPASSIAHPAGGIVSTAEDLTRFAKALLANKIISEKSFREMTRPHVPESPEVSYGYGVRISETSLGSMISHGGDVLGYNCRLDIYSDRGLIVAVLSNEDQTAKNLADFIEEIMFLE